MLSRPLVGFISLFGTFHLFSLPPKKHVLIWQFYQEAKRPKFHLIAVDPIQEFVNYQLLLCQEHLTVQRRGRKNSQPCTLLCLWISGNFAASLSQRKTPSPLRERPVVSGQATVQKVPTVLVLFRRWAWGEQTSGEEKTLPGVALCCFQPLHTLKGGLKGSAARPMERGSSFCTSRGATTASAAEQWGITRSPVSFPSRYHQGPLNPVIYACTALTSAHNHQR